jgi:hypothetical protein
LTLLGSWELAIADELLGHGDEEAASTMDRCGNLRPEGGSCVVDLDLG